jgi:hypothetical protein
MVRRDSALVAPEHGACPRNAQHVSQDRSAVTDSASGAGCLRAPSNDPVLARALLRVLSRRKLAMIAGVVTTKDVLLHSATIVQDFGLRAWLSCCKAILTNRRTTFLELVWL